MLNKLFNRSSLRNPDAEAVVGEKVTFSYHRLASEAARIAGFLKSSGVKPGDRVAIWMKKSPKTVAAMHAVLQVGAVYVPLDPVGPIQRAGLIIRDCQVSALIHDRHDEDIQAVLSEDIVYLRLNGQSEETETELLNFPTEFNDIVEREPRDLAYILYTSGSTGAPKGVCISHENALAFVNWAAENVGVRAEDRLANHAPFHFDLSVFDIYAAFHAGAAVYLVPETIAYIGARLSQYINDHQITIWYSVPTAIMMMCDQGGFLEKKNLSLHTLIFAGEVFPVKKLALVQKAHPQLRLLNYFGPTETNVCTFYEVSENLENAEKPVAIGAVCSGNIGWAQKENGEVASAVGEEGELIIQGPTVMLGYWGKELLPEGHKYSTGDVVKLLPENQFYYIGRKDHMVKIQGFRVELGEIEAVLNTFAGVEKSAVIVLEKEGRKELIAFIQYSGEQKPSLIQLKGHCATSLPRYMVVNQAIFMDALPRTANGKIDRVALTRGAENYV